MNSANRLGFGRIFVFWSPLAMTWFMMALEGPILAAIVARLADPKANLAAHGVAFAIAIIIEAPVIMMMSASTALAGDRDSFIKLRHFTYGLNAAITLVMAALLFTPGMDFITRQLIGLPDDVARLVKGALFILLPWPAAIGYRRFYQGLLIRAGMTRRVAYGTGVRLGAMCVTGWVLYFTTDLPGAYVSASALTAGVLLEAIAARIMAATVTRRLIAGEKVGATNDKSYSYREIGRFYLPLALTSTISLAVHPMVSFFVGQGRFPLESLAVIPVINGLVFLFRALGLSFQEAAIALIGESREHRGEVCRFAFMLALIASAGLGLIAATPLSRVWFESISGLTPELSDFAVPPSMILMIIPGLSVLLSLQRAILIKNRNTTPVTWATFIEVGGVLAVLYVTIEMMDMVGAVAAAIALLLGRIGGNLFLVRPSMK